MGKIPVKGIVKGASVGALHYADGKWTLIQAVCMEDGAVACGAALVFTKKKFA